MSTAWNWILVIVGVILILIEVVIGAASGFDFLLIGSAILIGGGLGLLVHSTAVGVATAGVLSLVYVFVGRSRIRGRLKRPGIPSNTDALIGRKALVVESISDHQPGRIKLEGEEWRAVFDETASASSGSRSFPAGASVHVSRIDGVTVYVVAEGSPEAAGGDPQ